MSTPDPVFAPVLESICPRRIATRQEIDERDAHPPFNEFDADIMHDTVAVERLVKPVQELLEARTTAILTQGSFGVDYRKCFESLMPKLDALYEACKAEWEDM